MNCALVSEDCAGRLEWHHAIKQQRLKRMFKRGAIRPTVGGVWNPLGRLAARDRWVGQRVELDDILGDTRNRIFLCSHHHELVTNGRVKVELPEQVWEFAREFGLDGALENDLRRAA